ncbi:MAG: hypothetical protein ACOX71_00730 [Lachnospiraceae bacterium]|jgi:rhamnosyltransferase
MIDVVIMSHCPNPQLSVLVKLLERQTITPGHIIILNVGEQYWDDSLITDSDTAEVIHIDERSFDPAEYMNMALDFSGAEHILFISQNAVPVNDKFIFRLMRSFRNPKVKAAYARAVTPAGREDINTYEFLEYYPEEPALVSYDDYEDLGVVACLGHPLCMMYDAGFVRECGGFDSASKAEPRIVMNAKILASGKKISYSAFAEFMCSTRESLRAIFGKWFNIGSVFSDYSELFPRDASKKVSGDEHANITGYLKETGNFRVMLSFVFRGMIRKIGFSLGKQHLRLPSFVSRMLSYGGFCRK